MENSPEFGGTTANGGEIVMQSGLERFIFLERPLAEPVFLHISPDELVGIEVRRLEPVLKLYRAARRGIR